jgi:hypothetical protein
MPAIGEKPELSKNANGFNIGSNRNNRTSDVRSFDAFRRSISLWKLLCEVCAAAILQKKASVDFKASRPLSSSLPILVLLVSKCELLIINSKGLADCQARVYDDREIQTICADLFEAKDSLKRVISEGSIIDVDLDTKFSLMSSILCLQRCLHMCEGTLEAKAVRRG